MIFLGQAVTPLLSCGRVSCMSVCRNFTSRIPHILNLSGSGFPARKSALCSPHLQGRGFLFRFSLIISAGPIAGRVLASYLCSPPRSLKSQLSDSELSHSNPYPRLSLRSSSPRTWTPRSPRSMSSSIGSKNSSNARAESRSTAILCCAPCSARRLTTIRALVPGTSGAGVGR